MVTSVTRFLDLFHEGGIKQTSRILFSNLFSFEIRNYYMYECILRQEKESDFLPRIKDVTCKILEKVEDLEHLLSEGYDLSLLDIPGTRLRLKKGAIGFFLFVDKELGFRGWGATTKEAKEYVDRGYQVEFDKGQVCLGGDWTNPKYRGNRLQTYGNFKKREYLMMRGFKSFRCLVAVDNIATQKMHFQDKVYAIVSNVKVTGVRRRIDPCIG